MLNEALTDEELQPIKNFLDGVFYSYIDEILNESDPQYFPEFLRNHTRISNLSLFYAFCYSLFKLGHTVDEDVVKVFLPDAIKELMVRAGLLVDEQGSWRTPGVSIICTNGVYLFVPVAGHYPSSKFFEHIPDRMIRQSLTLLPRNCESVLNISDSNYGAMALIASSLKGIRSSIVNDGSDVSRNLIGFSIRFNGLSKKVRSISFGEINKEVYDFAFFDPILFKQTALDKDAGKISKYSLVELPGVIESIPLKDDASILLSFDIIGNKREIPKLKESCDLFLSSLGYQSQVLVMDKLHIEVYFKRILERSLSNWYVLAGIKDSVFISKRDKWLKAIGIEDSSDKYIYRIHWSLSKSKPVFEFETLYQPNNYDPLYALSKLSYK